MNHLFVSWMQLHFVALLQLLDNCYGQSLCKLIVSNMMINCSIFFRYISNLIIFLRYFLLINLASTNTICKTVGGPDPFKKCVFPFTWNGNTYYGCPTDPDDSSKTWCSTSVDGRGNHITGQKKYGFCNDACPKHSLAPKLKGRYRLV